MKNRYQYARIVASSTQGSAMDIVPAVVDPWRQRRGAKKLKGLKTTSEVTMTQVEAILIETAQSQADLLRSIGFRCIGNAIAGRDSGSSWTRHDGYTAEVLVENGNIAVIYAPDKHPLTEPELLSFIRDTLKCPKCERYGGLFPVGNDDFLISTTGKTEFRKICKDCLRG